MKFTSRWHIHVYRDSVRSTALRMKAHGIFPVVDVCFFKLWLSVSSKSHTASFLPNGIRGPILFPLPGGVGFLKSEYSHSGNYSCILTSVASARNRFFGFRNCIGASEPFLSQRFSTRLRKKKEPGGYGQIQRTSKYVHNSSSRNGSILKKHPWPRPYWSKLTG